MQVWITRTDTSAAKSAKNLAARGFDPLIAPLLKLAPVSTPHAAPPEDCALAFTSGNGVRAFTALTDRRHWPVFAVGQATGELAQKAGFETVIVGSGDVSGLAALITQHAPDHLVHLSGVHVAGDLVGELTAQNISAERTIIYAAHAQTQLPEAAVNALGSSDIMAVFLYSPKAAQTFKTLLIQGGFEPKAQHLHIVSISAAVDAVLGRQGFGSRIIAKAPNESEMIAALEIVAHKA